MTNEDLNAKRLTNLETSLMHLQSDYDSLNEVVLENSKRLQEMTDLLVRLTEKLESAKTPEPPRKPEDEKPPHY